ncbi:MAG TPA: hypothetical protein VE135_13735 [Pyrinomonadaceae bacterium]|nr:hypothetical protein [Pyrinomonadaceae bacterium]
MQNAFSIFYAVLFGAMLSAEMSWNVFKYDPDGAAPAALTLGGYALRVLTLILGRAVFFAIAYPVLPSKLNERYVVAFLQVLCSLVLCLPVFGFQQLLYAIRPDANPRAIGSSKKFAWLSVIATAVVVIAVLVSVR